MTAGEVDPVPGFAELSDIDAANVVRCVRVLLRRPLVRAGGPDGDLLPLMYHHRSVLQELFGALLGYRLVVERRFARLVKAGAGSDGTRGEASLTPRGYAYVALALAALTGIGRQVLLSRLVSDIRAAAVEAGVPVTDDQADRRVLTAALRHLVSLGVITETEGTVSAESSSEALITIDTDLLGQIVVGPVGAVSSPVELIETTAAPSSDEVEHAVRRRLVEDPAVLYADLPAEQARWLRNRLGREAHLLERFFGLVAETRWEGVVVTDPEDYLTDVVFPGPSTVARIALLALPQLLSGEPRGDGRHPVTRRELSEACRELVEQHPSAWSRQATEDHEQLVDGVLSLLRRLSLITAGEQDWLLSPAAHRWLPRADAAPATREAEPPPEPEPEPADLPLFDATELAATKEDTQR